MAGTEWLLDGFKRFHIEYFGDDRRLFASMKNGQPAKTLVIACCDSRVDPEIITDCNPGDLFVIRNIANLIPPYETGGDYHGTSAALEFAINALEVEDIIVMGHAGCGGIKALWESDDDDCSQSQFIHAWMSLAKPAKTWVKKTLAESTPEAQVKACEQRAVLESLTNLMTFSCVRERVERGALSLHGWYFDIPAGDLLCFNAQTDEFEAVGFEAAASN